MPLKKILSILLLAGLALPTGDLHAVTLYQKHLGNHEIEFEFDPYYANVDYYIPLTRAAIPFSGEQNELEIYRTLFLSRAPRELVMELSVNPMPLLGVYLRKNNPDLYRRADVTRHFNLVRSICAGFEEPYAVSLFLGNVVSFRPRGADARSQGKGYAGLLLSGGDYHIKDSELIEDRWAEAEIKIKGDRLAPENKMSWSFRVGAKVHENPYIKDVIYFSVRRDRVDYDCYDADLFKNSGAQYTFDVDSGSGNVIRHYFRVGKKMPVRNSKIAFGVNTGIIWEGTGKYSGPLKRPGETSNFQVFLQPNMTF